MKPSAAPDAGAADVRAGGGLKTLPAQLMGQVGSSLENYQNQQLGQDYQRYLMKQQAPWIGFQNLMAPPFRMRGQKIVRHPERDRRQHESVDAVDFLGHWPGPVRVPLAAG
jgi:hypothetical protein